MRGSRSDDGPTGRWLTGACPVVAFARLLYNIAVQRFALAPCDHVPDPAYTR